MTKRLSTTDKKKIQKFTKGLYKIFNDNDLGDPLVGNKLIEVLTSIELKHKISKGTVGADASNKGEGCEYKNTNGKKLKGRWHALPIGKTENETVKLFCKLKMKKCNSFYFTRTNRNTCEIEEIWEVPKNKLKNILIPKLRKAYKRVHKTMTNDLAVQIFHGDIKKYGKRIK